MTDTQQTRIAHDAARAIVRAARNGGDTAAFAEAVKIHTAQLSKAQLRIVVGQLAGLLGVFYGLDSLSVSAGRTVQALEAWLRDGPTP